MNYDGYKSARDMSWTCLIDCGIRSLPIPLSNVCKHYGYTVIKNSTLPADSEFTLKQNERGRNVVTDSSTFIIVRDTDSLPIQRYSIAHEIGHILLGHNHTENITRNDEDETERFAIDLLAPACVLWGLNLHTPEEISAACNISITSSKKRAERMKVLYARGKFLLHPLEGQVYKQFEEFIKYYKK